ncbi:hypothetical protein JTE90_015680 [Oedothorax gibbosus]|uniref:Uncharacterized protein n=1 Tax=Oedothorax gibbosus TaxID=931172 RepID=A0AAV6U2R8_9ARAC|nr:hypothetical protein JTE90_015680 [Oedothorax gibbosus]
MCCWLFESVIIRKEKTEKWLLNGTNVEPTAPNPSNNFPVTYPFSPLDNEWWLWVIMISFACTVITVMLLCLICRKPYKTAVVRLSEDLPLHYAGTDFISSAGTRRHHPPRRVVLHAGSALQRGYSCPISSLQCAPGYRPPAHALQASAAGIPAHAAAGHHDSQAAIFDHDGPFGLAAGICVDEGF